MSHVTFQYLYSSLKVQDPTPRNPYILQMNANGMKKDQKVKVNQPRSNDDMKVAAKLFSKWFASPVRGRKQVWDIKKIKW